MATRTLKSRKDDAHLIAAASATGEGGLESRVVHAHAGADSDSAAAANGFGAELVSEAGRSPEVVAFDRSVVSFFVGAADLLGVPKSVAAIYGICFSSPEPLTFSEIQERLEISAGSISQGLRVLRDVGALKVTEAQVQLLGGQVAVRAPRPRERFEPDLELRKLVSRFFEQRLDRQLDSGRGALQEITQRIPAVGPDSARVLKSRLKALQAWHDKARKVLPVAKAVLKLS